MKNNELAMLVAIGLLLAVIFRLESIQPKEYLPLPSVLISDAKNENDKKQWDDAAKTQIVSLREKESRLRVRIFLQGVDGEDTKEHAAFIVNKKSWIDGGDGWLYYRDTLYKNEMTEPICLQAYVDRQGMQKQICAALICEWKNAS